MLVLVIVSSLIAVYFAVTFATIIAWESLTMDRTPEWLDTLYEVVTFQWR